MHPKQFAAIGGSIMLLIALASFVPSFSQDPIGAGLPELNLNTSYGLFLGIFPMNILNKIALLIFGVAGILAARAKNTNLPASIAFSRWVFFVMGAAAVLGLIPQTNTFFGYWPLFGNEAIAHGVFALLGAYFGFALPAKAHAENVRRDPNIGLT